MRVDRITSFAFALLVALPTAAPAFPLVQKVTDAPEGAALELVKAEREFCKKAAESSIRDAFYENMASDGVIFRPGPVKAKEFYQGRPSNPGPVLTWWPTYAEIAGSGDLGWTTGPWEYRSAKDKPAEAFGHFATVWQKQTNGKWRVLIDEGHSCAQPPPDSLSWARGRGRLDETTQMPKLAVFSRSHEDLRAVDDGYSQALTAKGIQAALTEFADEDVLLYREDKPAVVGVAAAGRDLAHEWDAGATAWDLRVGAIATSLDLAFSYGTVDVPAHGKEKAGSRKVFRIWRRGADGPWKLCFDATNVMPPPPAPPKPTKPAAGGPSH
jgi:ketosteroid isomerase-like protein